MTTSFVAKVLEHAGQLEQKAIHEKLDILTRKLVEMEVEIYQLAESKYVNFRPNLSVSEKLGQKVHGIEDEISSLESKINTEIKAQLTLSTGEFQNLNQELSKAKLILSGLDYLAEIYDLLQTSAKAVDSMRYSEAAVALNKLEELFKHSLCEQDKDITILKAMETELSVQKCKLDCVLSDMWQEAVKWNVQSDKKSAGAQEDDVGSLQEISVAVNCEGSCASDLRELVEGLHMRNLLNSRMKVFSERVQKYLVPFVTENSELKIEVKTVGSAKTLIISRAKKYASSQPKTIKSKNVVKDSGEETTYISVFAYLLEILESLHSMLLHIEYGWQETSSLEESDTSTAAPGAGKGTLMSLLGLEVGSWLLDLLQHTVLAKAVPTSAKDLEGFSSVIGATQLLQEKLLTLGLIQPDNRTLLDHVENVNMLFANKKSQAILEEARDLMISSLHDTVAVAEDKPIGEWPPLTPGGVKKGKRIEVAADHQLSDNTFRMPKCRISQNVQSLMTLAYETMNEATESSTECGVQMFYAVKSMFEAFCHIVPTHHGQSLEMFPQIAALHHNNCMFIAHHLLTLGHQFAPKLPPTITPTFMDLIQEIRQSGVDVFVSQMNRQRGLLLECLDGAEGFGSVEEDKNYENAERAIKQVLLQLSHLQKIWKPVLPINVYKKAMGKLIQSVVERITDCISSLEDIAQDAAHRLICLLRPAEDECGELLTSPGEVAHAELLRHVQSWSRLTEMKFLLDASLSDIGDRWAEGKGPLAVAYSPVEVKQLIRALFQNTDRRANLLSTIK